jgi:hypothetical protein
VQRRSASTGPTTGVHDILETVPSTHKANPVTYKSMKDVVLLSHWTSMCPGR